MSDQALLKRWERKNLPPQTQQQLARDLGARAPGNAPVYQALRDRITAGLNLEAIDALLQGLTAGMPPHPQQDWILPRLLVLDQLQPAAKDGPTPDRFQKARDELIELLELTR